MKNKRALTKQTLVGIIFVTMVLILFTSAIWQRTDSRGVKQDMTEKQTALLIDSAISGTNIIIYKKNNDMIVNSVEIKNSNVYINIDGLVSISGYPFFSKYTVYVVEEEDSFNIIVK